MAISKVILNGVTQMDVTDTTATAADVASGKVFYGADGVRTVGTSSGGGGEPVSRSDVNFYDYDGTLLHSYTVAQINDSGFSMPSNPTHTGLTAQGWNWTLAQLRTQLTAMPTQAVDVGQMYITDDGKTRIYIHLEDGRLHPYLGICPNGTVVVDWGDGSATSTLTGTSLTTEQVADHTYASGGDYMIALTVSSGSFAICGSSNTTYLLRKNTTTTANISRVYNNSIKKVEMGANASIGDYAFQNCQSLATINIPSSVTSIGTYAFRSCYSLASVIIPSDVTSIETYTFNGCESLVRVAIPSGVTSIENYAFTTCHSFAFITMPNGLTSIGTNVFNACSVISSIAIPSNVTSIGANTYQSCLTLSNITIPSGVTSIGNSAFSTCFGLGEIHFKPTTPPTVSNSNAWTSIPTDCKIYVPAGKLSAYTSASNYPSSSTYTYIEE